MWNAIRDIYILTSISDLPLVVKVLVYIPWTIFLIDMVLVPLVSIRCWLSGGGKDSVTPEESLKNLGK